MANAEATRAETMTWLCMGCGHKWRDMTECKGVVQTGCPACGSRQIIDCNVGAERATDPCDGCLRVGIANCTACIEEEVAHG